MRFKCNEISRTVWRRHALQLPALGRPGGHTHRMYALLFTPCDVYLWLESRAEIMNVWYCMDSAIAPDRHSDSAVDSSSVLPVLVLLTSLPRAGSRCDGTPGPPTQNRPRNIRVRAKGSVVLWQCLELASSRWPGYSSEPVLNHGGTVA